MRRNNEDNEAFTDVSFALGASTLSIYLFYEYHLQATVRKLHSSVTVASSFVGLNFRVLLECTCRECAPSVLLNARLMIP